MKVFPQSHRLAPAGHMSLSAGHMPLTTGEVQMQRPWVLACLRPNQQRCRMKGVCGGGEGEMTVCSSHSNDTLLELQLMWTRKALSG